MSDDVSRPETALIVRPTVLPSLAQFEIMRQLAGRLFKARGFLPSHYMVGPEDERFAKVLAAIEYGRAVGVEPMIALQNLNNIDGKIGASALLIGAQLRKSGYDPATSWYDKEGNACPKESPNVWGCKVVMSKNGRVTGDGVFSLTDAQRAGLLDKTNWKTYPKDMLYSRALTQAAREGAQDAVLGMAYTAEELGADVDSDGQVINIPPPPSGVIDATFVDVVDGQAPGVSEATVVSPPPATVIQPTPPAPAPVEVPPAAIAVGADEQSPGAGGSGEGAPINPAPATTPPPPQTPANAVPVAPLAGANISRRLGPGRSISPVRKNVTTVQPPQAAETPATAPAEPEQPLTAPEAAPSQPAPSALTDEPDLPEPVDPGKQQYLNDLRGDLRVQTATLYRVNALLDNVKRGLEGKEPNEVPLATPSEASDNALAARIDQDWPGRKLENLGETELSSLMERFVSNLATKRAVMKERGISEE